MVQPRTASAHKSRAQTERAEDAMRMAFGYLEEVVGNLKSVTDRASSLPALETLSLATRCADTAQATDPHATLYDDETDTTVTQTQLRAQLLRWEAGVRTNADQYDKAITVAEQAVALDPAYADAWYLLGLLYGTVLKKSQAVYAFERAVHLDPNNMVYAKELHRAQNMSELASGLRFLRRWFYPIMGAVCVVSTLIGINASGAVEQIAGMTSGTSALAMMITFGFKIYGTALKVKKAVSGV